MNIPNYIIHIDDIKKSRGRKILFKLSGEDEFTKATYIPSSICRIKSLKINWDGDEYYLFKSKNIGLFMLEKDVIYECSIDCSQWEDLINV